MGLVEVMDVRSHNFPTFKHIVLLLQALAEVLIVMLHQVHDSTHHLSRYTKLLGNLLMALPVHERHVRDPNLVIEL